jgi:hypothetical protein
MGDPSADGIWTDLDAVLFEREWQHESGAKLKIFATASTRATSTERVLRYCAPEIPAPCVRGERRVESGAPFIPKRPTRNNKHRCPLVHARPERGKKLLYGRFKIVGVNFDGALCLPLPLQHGRRSRLLRPTHRRESREEKFERSVGDGLHLPATHNATKCWTAKCTRWRSPGGLTAKL